jgi:DNA-binding HxlR family transcriptional regulator
MKNEEVKKLLQVLKVLGNFYRLKIIMLFYKENDHISFKELQKLFSKSFSSSSGLRYHLQVLERTGFLTREGGTSRNPFFRLPKTRKKIIKRLIDDLFIYTMLKTEVEADSQNRHFYLIIYSLFFLISLIL